MSEYKNYNILHDPALNLKFVKIVGKGSVPLELRGHYTNEVTAKSAIDKWLKKKEVIDGEVSSSG